MSSTAKENILVTTIAAVALVGCIILYTTGTIDKEALGFIGTFIGAAVPVYIAVRKINADTQAHADATTQTTPVTPAATAQSTQTTAAPVAPVINITIDNHTEIHYHTYDTEDTDRVDTTVVS